MPIIGILRIKSEARWIKEVIESILPVCERVLVLDDHSEDDTPEICEAFGDPVTVYRSKFDGLDETRDRQFLLDRAMELVPTTPTDWLSGGTTSPWWALACDGDEILVPTGPAAIRKFIEDGDREIIPVPRPGDRHVAKLRVRYLWNDRQHYRVDGVYAQFARPSLFRLMNRMFKFQTTPWGGNFHCSSIPQELLHHAHEICEGADLLHLGYMDQSDRLRKFEFYNTMDPNNIPEDRYRHMLVGDTFPADSIFRHGGPLQLKELPCA